MKLRWRRTRILFLLSLTSVFIVLALVLVTLKSGPISNNKANAIWLISPNNLSLLAFHWQQNLILKDPKDIGKTLLEPINSLSSRTYHSFDEFSDLRTLIRELNTKQVVYNQDIYGYLPSPNNFQSLKSYPHHVFVVQVHNRPNELAILIESLRRVKGIERALVIFSHDVYSDKLNKLVSLIGFVRYVQIFYPHSIQNFPNTFPGDDPKDCTGRITKEKPKYLNCTNANWYDTYGHFRESKFTQIKHHWLWKMEFVFKHLYATRYFEGFIIFLEEDHFVVEDILHLVDLVQDSIWNPANASGILSLGSYTAEQLYQSNEAVINYWISSQHNMGMGVSRFIWERINKCIQEFCNYDDYNWDWSLQHLAQSCFKGQLKTITFPSSTRVYHLGECEGIHHNKKDCSSDILATGLFQEFSGPKLTRLYPNKLLVKSGIKKSTFQLRINGGWSDPRDRELCFSIVGGAWTDPLKKWTPNLVKYSCIY